MIRSYSKPLALTHKQVEPLRNFGAHLVYQEKVDGSQFSFRKVGGQVQFRSRRAEVHVTDPQMFDKGVEAVLDRAHLLVEGWTYRGEYLRKPKHNTLRYDRVPEGHVILFDVDRGECDYVSPDALVEVGRLIGLEVVPTWTSEVPPEPEWLTRTSCLGGAVVEGYVIKDYDRIGPDGKVLMAKVVRESFVEVHKKEWRRSNPNRKDVVARIIEEHRTEARWSKAVQHLAESGDLVNAPQDIGQLFKEVSQDIEEECADDIKEQLWQHFRKDILRGCTRGLPDWYKARLGEASR